MDHSVNGYLERRTTEELLVIIYHCLHQQSLVIQEPIIRKAMEIIDSRYDELPGELAEQMNQYENLLDSWVQAEKM